MRVIETIVTNTPVRIPGMQVFVWEVAEKYSVASSSFLESISQRLITNPATQAA